MVGVYSDGKLVETLTKEGKTSDLLAEIYADLASRYKIDRLIYVNSPGSFMSIKLTYIFLKSLSILEDVSLFAVDGFYLNQNQPIKAMAKLYFVKVSSKIITQKFETPPESRFLLPQTLDESEVKAQAEPIYVIGAIG
ncbi:MAG: hypothetical protein WCR69_02485 [Sulfuricurvum sp.]